MVTMIFGAVAAVGIFVLFLGLAQLRRAPGGSDEFQARLAQYGAGGGSTAAVVAAPAGPTSLRDRISRLFQPAADRIGQGDKKKGKASLAENLAKADLKLRTSEYIGIQFGCVVGLALIGLLRFGVGIQFVAMGVLGYFLPGFYVKYRQRRRLKAFNNQLGDTLILLSNALKAGYSFAQAIDTVSKNAVPPMSDEFSRAVREMNLGGSVEEALQNMVKRIDSPDLDLLVTAVAIHRTVGGNLAEILDNIAYTIRERIRIKGEIATLTAQARASGTLITLLPIALGIFMYFVTPTYFKPMTENVIGWVMIGVALFFIGLGNAIIRKIVAIEV
jgi:tight adherence protein B